MKIEGIPEGYEIVRIGRPEKRELFIDSTGQVGTSNGLEVSYCFAIVRKIEKPKQYRPFANAEEFKPHRDRWVRSVEGGITRRIVAYSETEVVIIRQGSWGYDAAFEWYVFDDDTPFGVEVSE